MNTDYLDHSERASTRARIYMESGAYDEAQKAFLEAADAMLRFAEIQQGERKTNARKVAELLLQKAKTAREKRMNTAASTVTSTASAASETPVQDPSAESKKPEKPTQNKPDERHKNDNRSAINRDIQSYQKTAANKPSSGGEDRLKFVPVESPNVYFKDIAGLESVKNIIQMKVIQPILHPELYERFSKASNGGILLYGPPGTGKTMIAQAIATETNLSFFSIRCSDIVGKTFGDGERNLKALFDAARENGRAMIFFDEFEALACRRGGGSTIMNRIVPELLSQMDGFQKSEGLLIVLASTNRPWDLDSAVLRPPRMTERIYVGLPDLEARRYIVKKELEPLPKHVTPDYDSIAQALEGYNCADIKAFVEKVKEAPIRRGLKDPDVEQFIIEEDIAEALMLSHSSVQKSDLEAFSKWEATQR